MDSGYGKWKLEANQGIAPPVISKLKKVLKRIESLNDRTLSNNHEHRQPVVDLKKAFVDDLQGFLEPEQAHIELEEIRNSIT